eukprot:11247780-Alexandrium_andersonii.AAC.1
MRNPFTTHNTDGLGPPTAAKSEVLRGRTLRCDGSAQGQHRHPHDRSHSEKFASGWPFDLAYRCNRRAGFCARPPAQPRS